MTVTTGTRPATLTRAVAPAFRVFRRELRVWLPDWRRHAVFSIAESTVAVIAFGILLGKYVTLPGGGRYIDFVAPALVLGSCLQTVTLDGLYATRTNLYDRRLFESMLTAPLTIAQVIGGELMWHAFRATFQGTIMAALFLAAGADFSPSIVLLPLLLAVAGPCFSAPAMLWTSMSPKFTNLLYFNTLVVAPLYYLSGVFFPVDALPEAVRPLVQISPLYQAIHVGRAIFAGHWDGQVAAHALTFVVMAAALMGLTITRFVHKMTD
ncbi:ABC transporter permease [Catenuloplanes sp. NPDC051500]|uniref:ABC transporter permease n=1 Tax=Catenuloplanes sp. NPDC051500 TaxID=3363959 RepID=UPI0037AC7EF0